MRDGEPMPKKDWPKQTEGLQRYRAERYLERHGTFVEHLLIMNPKHSFEPAGSDAIHPELWKAAHWRWWLAKTGTGTGTGTRTTTGTKTTTRVQHGGATENPKA